MQPTLATPLRELSATGIIAHAGRPKTALASKAPACRAASVDEHHLTGVSAKDHDLGRKAGPVEGSVDGDLHRFDPVGNRPHFFALDVLETKHRPHQSLELPFLLSGELDTVRERPDRAIDVVLGRRVERPAF